MPSKALLGIAAGWAFVVGLRLIYDRRRTGRWAWQAWRAVQRERLITALRIHGEESGYPLARCAGVGVGRVYALLARLENEGVVTSRWQDGPAPRRRLYRLAGSPTGRLLGMPVRTDVSLPPGTWRLVDNATGEYVEGRTDA